MTEDRKICVGMIAGVHGIKGQVRLRSFTDDPEAIFKYKPLMSEDGKQEFKVKRQGVSKEFFIAAVDGVVDRNGAEALHGTKLFVERTKLPKAKKNEYYESDLVGLVAKDGQGKSYGKILGVHNHGAGTFLEIGSTKKDSFMLPFTNTYVPDVNIKQGFALIAPPDGWLDKEEKSPITE